MFCLCSIKTRTAESTLKDMEDGWRVIVEKLHMQLETLRKQIEEGTARETKLEARVEEIEKEGRGSPSSDIWCLLDLPDRLPTLPISFFVVLA